jgi:F-type H+-transporting ATPase subunit b
MIHKKQILFVILILPLFLFFSVEEEHHSSGLKDFIGKVINFVILIGGLTFLLYKPIKKYFGERSDQIENSMNSARQSKKEAGKRLKEAQKRLTKLTVEIENIKEEAKKDGLEEKERIITSAREEADRKKQLVLQEIEMLSSAGIKEIREYIANLVTEQAQEKIIKKITPESQVLLIDKSIERLEQLYEKPSVG